MTNTISLIFNSQSDCKDALLKWIKQKNITNPLFITDEHTSLSISPCISIAELIPIMSKTEEAIYRLHYHYRRFFANQLPIYSQKINLLADELHAYPFETAARCLAAFLTVKDQYQDVIFIFSQSDMALILQLSALLKVTRQNGMTTQENIVIFDEKNFCFDRVRGGFYRFYVRKFFDRYHSSPCTSRGKNLMRSSSHFREDRLAKNASQDDNVQKNTSRRDSIPPLLFITNSSALHRRNFKPVYEALCKALSTTPLAVAITKKAEALAREDGIVLTSLISPKRLFCSFKFCMRVLILMIKSNFLRLIYVRRIKRLAKSSSHTQKTLFFQQLIILFSKQGLSARLLRSLIKTEQMDRFIQEHHPSAIYKNVAASSYDHRLAFTAQKYGIPVMTSIVASIASRYRNFGIFPCDFVTLLGKNQKPIMYKRGYSDGQLICVGQPELDNIRVSTSNKNDLFTILIATGYVNLSEEKIWITALNEFAERSNFPLQILLKPHPSAQNFYTTLNHLQHIHIQPADADIYACLTAAQLVITDVSHVGKLAIYFEKPLMAVNFSGRDFPFNNFAQESVAWLATDATKMGQLIGKVHSGRLQINQQAYADYISSHLTNNDHKACNRIVDLLLSIT